MVRQERSSADLEKVAEESSTALGHPGAWVAGGQHGVGRLAALGHWGIGQQGQKGQQEAVVDEAKALGVQQGEDAGGQAAHDVLQGHPRRVLQQLPHQGLHLRPCHHVVLRHSAHYFKIVLYFHAPLASSLEQYVKTTQGISSSYKIHSSL